MRLAAAGSGWVRCLCTCVLVLPALTHTTPTALFSLCDANRTTPCTPCSDTQLPRSQSFNTHRTRKGMGPDGAVSQQAWRPFQTGRHMQSAMGAAANAHVHELRKMTKLQLRRKRREEVEANRRRVQVRVGAEGQACPLPPAGPVARATWPTTLTPVLSLVLLCR